MRQQNDLSLNFFLLKCLVALVDHSHVTRASEALAMSQPAMSRAMSQLRQITGDPILVKGETGLVPTAKAVQLREFASRILKEMDELLGHALAFAPQKSRRTFSIIATDYLECVFLDPVLGRLAQEFPAISAAVAHPVNPKHLNKLLESGEADFCVGMLPATLEDLRHRLLFRDRIACIGSRAHHGARAAMDPAEFAALDHVIVRPTVRMFGEAADEALADLGLARNQKLVTPSYLSVPYIVEASSMVALVPQTLAERFCRQFDLVSLPLPLTLAPYEVYVYWHERTQHHLDHVWFRTQLLRAAEALESGS